MEVRHLRLIHAIAETGSMRRAAERLHLSQPALSRQVSGLEQQLGMTLFHRSPRMHLTAAGEELLVTAQSVLAQLQATEERLIALSKGTVGLLRLSTECNTCYYWLPQQLARFRKAYSGVMVQVVAEATPNPLPWLVDGRLDVAIVNSEPDLRRVTLTPLFEDEMVAVVSPLHPWASRAFVEAADFGDEHLYVYNTPLTANRIFQQVLKPAGVRPRQVTSMPLSEATIELVKAGLGIAVLARWAVARSLADGSLTGIRVTKQGLKRQWSAARRNDEPAPAYLAAFIRMLSESSLADNCDFIAEPHSPLQKPRSGPASNRKQAAPTL